MNLKQYLYAIGNIDESFQSQLVPKTVAALYTIFEDFKQAIEAREAELQDKISTFESNIEDKAEESNFNDKLKEQFNLIKAQKIVLESQLVVLNAFTRLPRFSLVRKVKIANFLRFRRKKTELRVYLMQVRASIEYYSDTFTIALEKVRYTSLYFTDSLRNQFELFLREYLEKPQDK